MEAAGAADKAAATVAASDSADNHARGPLALVVDNSAGGDAA